jgi:hypothetical protein
VEPVSKRAKKRDRAKGKSSSQKADPVQGEDKDSQDMASQGMTPTHEEKGKDSIKPKKARKKSKKKGQSLN